MSSTAELNRAYELAGLVVNAAQVTALAALVETGRLEGTVLPDVEPPSAVALVGVGPRETIDDSPPTTALAVVAEDGRAWQIVGAGITWPIEQT